VARPRNPALAVRNDQVYAEWRGGRSLAWLAEKYQRTPQQIGRIVADRHPDLEDDTDRSLHRGRLESLYEEVQAVVDAPGVKLAPNGRPAEGMDGEPLEDTGAKIEALKLKLMVLESTRKLDARDKPVKKILQTDPDTAWREAQVVLAAEKAKLDAARLAASERRELEALRQQAGRTIPGQVVAELPPGA
jgi:hypothetical protein